MQATPLVLEVTVHLVALISGWPIVVIDRETYVTDIAGFITMQG